MTVLLVIFLAVLAFIIKTKREIDAFKAGFAGKVVNVLKERNMEVASALGLTVAHFFMDKVKRSVREKKKA